MNATRPRVAATLPVSVVIPAYNRESLLERALESVRAQRPLGAAEVIVVDDCSTDGTAQVAEALGAHVLRHETNRGAATARNTGIAAATQDWIALLDSDDEWLPNLLSTLWPLRADNVLVAGTVLQLGHRAGLLIHGVAGARARAVSAAEVVYPFNPIPASGVMVRRDVLQGIGGYDTTLRFAEDWEMWLRVLGEGRAIQTPDVVGLHHRHPGQKSALRPLSVQREILERHAAKPWCTRGLRERRYGAVEWDALRAAWRGGRRPEAGRRLAGLMVRPRRAHGAAGLVAHRVRQRRRTRIAASGLGISEGST